MMSLLAHILCYNFFLRCLLSWGFHFLGLENTFPVKSYIKLETKTPIFLAMPFMLSDDYSEEEEERNQYHDRQSDSEQEYTHEKVQESDSESSDDKDEATNIERERETTS